MNNDLKKVKRMVVSAMIGLLIMFTVMIAVVVIYESKVGELEEENKQLKSQVSHFKLCTLNVVECDFES